MTLEQPMADTPDPTEAARQEVMALEADIYANPSSRRHVGHLLAEEFWEVSATGERVTRDVVLERLESSPVIVDEYPLTDTRVDVYGDVAISTGHCVLRGRMPLDDGTERAVERANRFVHVWVRRGGEWKTVYAHNSDAVED
jgi:hypothetical protein